MNGPSDCCCCVAVGAGQRDEGPALGVQAPTPPRHVNRPHCGCLRRRPPTAPGGLTAARAPRTPPALMSPAAVRAAPPTRSCRGRAGTPRVPGAPRACPKRHEVPTQAPRLRPTLRNNQGPPRTHRHATRNPTRRQYGEEAGGRWKEQRNAPCTGRGRRRRNARRWHPHRSSIAPRRRCASSRIPATGLHPICEGPEHMCTQNVITHIRTNHAGAGAPEPGALTAAPSRRAHYGTRLPPRALRNNKGSGRNNRRAAPNPTRCHCRTQHASEPRRPPRGAARRIPIGPFAQANRSRTHLSRRRPMTAGSRFSGTAALTGKVHGAGCTGA